MQTGIADMRDRAHARTDSSEWSQTGSGGVVATAHWMATQAGQSILKRGGNAFDAAIAASVALGVCEPAASGLGGMGICLVHDAGTKTTRAFMAPCRAPELATPEAIRPWRRRFGARVVAVPGLPALLAELYDGHASLPLTTLLAPAIEIAEQGYPVSPLQHDLLARHALVLQSGPARSFILGPERAPDAPFHVHRQPELAQTLRWLASNGFRDFYDGRVGRLMAGDLERQGSFLRAADLRRFGTVDIVDAVTVEASDGSTVATAPSPAGGETLLRLHLMWDACGRPDLRTADGVLAMASAIRRVRSDRRQAGLGTRPTPPLSREEASRAIRQARRDPTGETSHFCVMDSQGNAISMTQSLERCYGARTLTPELGFLYNGYIRTLKTYRESHPHYARPGAPARSNAAPTIIVGKEGPTLAIGSTGSERMQSGIMQTLARLDRESPFDAVAAPRFHATPEAILRFEPRLDQESVDALRGAGFELEALDPWAFAAGGLQLALRDGDRFTGVADPRRDGAALVAEPEDHHPASPA